MIIKWPLIFCFFLSGCAWDKSVEVSYGTTVGNPNWEGEGGSVDISLRAEKDNKFCALTHTSNLTSGPPFNNDSESYVDRLHCGMKFKLTE